MTRPNRTISIHGIPLDLGQSHRGVDMGAAAVRYAGLANTLRASGHTVIDRGDITVPIRDNVIESGEPFPTAIGRVCRELSQVSSNAVTSGEIPVFLGGDHTIAIGSIAGILDRKPCSILWIDAHADFNTPETSPSGNYHGMTLAVLLGEGDANLTWITHGNAPLAPSDIVIIGLRDLDDLERGRLAESGISFYTMRDIDERGMASIAREALERLEHREHLHVSFDVDSIDPQEAPGAGTLVTGGRTYREAQLLMEIIADHGGPDSLDIVEINPIIDCGNKTARLAVGLAASLFGKRII